MDSCQTTHHNKVGCEKTDHTKLLNNIISLQNLEAVLYKKLETLSASAKNKAEHDEIINEINRMSDERNAMFTTLNTSYENGKSYNSYKKSELADKLDLAQVMESDLNNKKNIQNSLVANKADKMRMVEINTYYASKYNAQSEIMKIIILTCVPLLIITILAKKGLIPENIGDILMALVIVAGVVIISMKFYDLSIRNNMNFDEYEWNVTPPSSTVADDPTASATATATASASANSSKHLFDSILNFGCVGKTCCSDGMYYNESKEQCFAGIKPKEGFVFEQEYPLKVDNKKKSIVIPFNVTQTDYYYVNG